MLAYVDRDPTGDLIIRDAQSNRTICYMPSCGPASGMNTAERKRVEAEADVICKALNAPARPTTAGGV